MMKNIIRYANTYNVNMIKPPLKMLSVSGCYATALYSAASKKESLSIVEKDLKKFHELTHLDPIYQSFAKNPLFPGIKKKDILIQLADKHGFSTLTKKFFETVCENNRMPILSKIIRDFEMMMKASRNEIYSTVTTESELDKSKKECIKQCLTKLIDPNQKLFVSFIVDKSIIGGMTIMLDDKFLDLSIATRLKDLQNIISMP